MKGEGMLGQGASLNRSRSGGLLGVLFLAQRGRVCGSGCGGVELEWVGAAPRALCLHPDLQVWGLDHCPRGHIPDPPPLLLAPWSVP